MTKIIEKIPGISALLLVAISIVLVTLIYVGGNGDPIDFAGESLTVPIFTDALLYWSYSLMALTLFITLFMALMGYVKSLISSPISAIKSLIPIALFVLIFVVAWNLGTGEKMSIIGYEGTENEGFWAQFSDMMIYAIYALFGASGLTIIGVRIYIKLK